MCVTVLHKSLELVTEAFCSGSNLAFKWGGILNQAVRRNISSKAKSLSKFLTCSILHSNAGDEVFDKITVAHKVL